MRILTTIIFFLSFTLHVSSMERPTKLLDTLAAMQAETEKSPLVSSAIIQAASESLLIVDTNGEQSTMYPHNLHRRLRLAETDEERQVMLERHVTATLGSLKLKNDNNFDLTDLRPVLRPIDFAKDTGVSPLSEPFLADLDLFFVLDRPETTEFVSRKMIVDSGVSLSATRRFAKENLSALGNELRIEGNQVYFLVLDGYYESSFVTADWLWEDIFNQIGPIAMIVPTKDLVVFGSRRSPEVIAFLEDTIRRMLKEDSLELSEKLHQWQNKGPWMLYSGLPSK